MVFVVLNGVAIGLGLLPVFLLPDQEVARPWVVVLCIWTYILGRISERAFDGETA